VFTKFLHLLLIYECCHELVYSDSFTYLRFELLLIFSMARSTVSQEQVMNIWLQSSTKWENNYLYSTWMRLTKALVLVVKKCRGMSGRYQMYSSRNTVRVFEVYENFEKTYTTFPEYIKKYSVA
jgi:hypothetical protein